jgi:prolipoprotein diacylglyceryl transferase
MIGAAAGKRSSPGGYKPIAVSPATKIPAAVRVIPIRLLASIPSPPSNGVHIGPLFVHAYGLTYAVAVEAAVALARWRWRARNGDPRLVDEVALCGVPAGLVGGRLYFLATSWNEVPDHWWGPLAVWKGGLGIWGGIVGGVLGGLLVLRRRGIDTPAFMDAAAASLLVAQGIGRIGNYFNQKLFGPRRACPGVSQSTLNTGQPSTRSTPPSTRRSSMS